MWRKTLMRIICGVKMITFDFCWDSELYNCCVICKNDFYKSQYLLAIYVGLFMFDVFLEFVVIVYSNGC